MTSIFPETVSRPQLSAGGANFLHDLARSLEAVMTVDVGVGRAIDQLITWRQRARDRRALSQLDEHLLHDIGLSRADVDNETSKPFWRS